MIHLITGGSGSGKSEYAETRLLQITSQIPGEKNLIYLATMRPYGADAEKKIKRHHALRKGKGFDTLECYEDLQELDIPVNHGILLECMSNLTANELYDKDGKIRDEAYVMQKILIGICRLEEQTPNLVIVTCEVTADSLDYAEETKAYQRVLGQINQKLAAMADRVTEVVYGIPIDIKKEELL